MQFATLGYSIASALNRVLRAVAPAIHNRLSGNQRFLEAYRTLRRRSIIRGTTAERFSIIYETKWWGSDALSGDGSTLASTEIIRRALPALFNKLKVRRLLDAPCGDFLWFPRMNLSLEQYTGGDIVPALIKRNNALFGGPAVAFKILDITCDPLPSADLWLCRDCFIHLDDASVLKALSNLVGSDITYFLASNYPDVRRNRNTFVGGFRPLNLLLPPFGLPPPLAVMPDTSEGTISRNLSLWPTTALTRLFSANTAIAPSRRLR
jgi:hypothetical protein